MNKSRGKLQRLSSTKKEEENKKSAGIKACTIFLIPL